ncbi:hypothetical protein [Vibrio sp. 10N.261.55.A7]|uniref:hypothetical protein n=1 Tax=Vibrio sp. 10N.261.55.A7 TaxID=1880851 RepID=UPI000C81DB0E|nr:hypothetical protein [Vibrio sp. 10N.261.55.A7]PMJ96396.1 hypothetical protein BCU12_04805 [Vibrio sp. 10N.261.55.A7]
MRITRTLVSSAILTVLVGCGGGDGGGETSSGGTTPGASNPGSSTPDQAQTKVGIFTDSAVSNLKYQTTKADGSPSLSGVTDPEGKFQFKAGETVTFSIGDLSLGSIVASEVITPLSLPAPIKVSQILQSFDSDGDPNTSGISIPEEIHELLEDTGDGTLVDKLVEAVEQVDEDFDMAFDTFFTEFEVEVANVNNDLAREIKMVKAVDAKKHLEKNEHIVKQGGVNKQLLDRLEDFSDDESNPKALFNVLKATGLFGALDGIDRKIDYTSAVHFEDGQAFDIEEVNQRIEKINALFAWATKAEKQNQLDTPEGKQSLLDLLIAWSPEEPLNTPSFDGLTKKQILELFVSSEGWLNPNYTLTRVNTIGEFQDYHAAGDYSINQTNVLLELLFPNLSLHEEYDYLEWIKVEGNYVNLAQSHSQLTTVTQELNLLDDIIDGDIEPREIKGLLDGALIFGGLILSDAVNYADIIRSGMVDGKLNVGKIKEDAEELDALIGFVVDETKKASLGTDEGKTALTLQLEKMGIPVPNLTGMTAEQILDLFDSEGEWFSPAGMADRTLAYKELQSYLATPGQKNSEKTRELIKNLIPDAEFSFDVDYLAILITDGVYIDILRSLADILAMNHALTRFEEVALSDNEPADVLAFLNSSSLVEGLTILNGVDYRAAMKSTIVDGKLVPSRIQPNVGRVSQLFSFSTDSVKKDSLTTVEGQTAFGQAVALFGVEVPDLTGFTSQQVLELFVRKIIWFDEEQTMARINAYKALQDYQAAVETQTIEQTKVRLLALFPDNDFDFEQDYLAWLVSTDNYINLPQSKTNLAYANEDLAVILKALQGEATADELSQILGYKSVFKNVSINGSVDYLAALQPGFVDGKMNLDVMTQNIVQWNTLFDYLTTQKESLATPEGVAAFTDALATFNVTPPDMTGLSADQILSLLGKAEGYYTVEATRQSMAGYSILKAYMDDNSQHNDRANTAAVLAEVFPDLDLKFDADYHNMIVVADGFIDVGATHGKLSSTIRRLNMFMEPNANFAFLWYAFQSAGIQGIDRDQDYRFKQLFDGGNFNLDYVQTMVATINSVAEFARKDAIWPSQLRFPNSVVSQDNWSATELQQLIQDAGFTIPITQYNGQVIDHKPDLILDHKTNVLDLVQTQRSLSAIGASGVATLKVNAHRSINHNFYHFALRNDGSIVAWRTDMDRYDLEDHTPVVVEMNKLGPKAIEMFAAQSLGAAIREDGSVMTWNSRNPNGEVTIPEGLDGSIPAVAIVATENAFAAIRNNGSVVTFGGGEEADSSKYQQDLDGSKHKVVSVHATNESFAALLDNGSVVTWGNIDAADQDKLALQVPGHGPGSREQDRHLMIDAIYSNQGAFAAIKGNGEVITWGDVGSGADLGEKQMFLNGDVSAVSIAATETAFAALRSDGRVVAWGDITKGGAAEFNRGDLPSWIWTDETKSEYQSWLKDEPYGDPNDPDGINWNKVYTDLVYVGSSMPENPAELESGVISVHASFSGFTALKADGKTQAWGSDMYFPDSVKNALAAQEVARVFAAGDIFVAEMVDGSLQQWGTEFGLTEWGEYGIAIPTEKLNGSIKVKDVKIDSSTIVALREDGSVVQWGVRDFELIPNYFIGGKDVPRIPMPAELFDGSLTERKVVEIYQVRGTFGALHADGSVTTWGSSNDNGNSLFAQRELGPNMTAVDYSTDHDADKDGVMSSVERLNGTSPYSRDTDGDGVDDGTEINALSSNPLTLRRSTKVDGKVAYDDKLLKRNGETLPASWLKH